MADEVPYQDDAERVVLGTMMIAPDTIETVTDRLSSGMFYRTAHATIYAYLTAAWAAGEPTDPIALLARMSTDDDRRVGGVSYLHDCVAAVPTAAQVGHYVDLVVDAAERRTLLEQAAKLSTAAQQRDRDRRTRMLAEIRDRLELGAEAGRTESEHAPVHGIPAYPARALSGPLAELVACCGGLPPALVGGAGLATLAAVCPTASLTVADSWVEQPILWVSLAAPRGAGKTPSMTLALGPIRDRDAAAHALYLDQLAMWRDTPPRDRGTMDRPVDPTRLIDDTTVEMLARRLSATSGAACVAADELSGMLGQLDRYHRGSGDRGRLLALWSGTPWRYQRVAEDLDILVPRPVVSIVGGIQPALHRLLGGDEDGMRPRWLPHLAPLAPASDVMAVAPTSWADTITTLHEDTGVRSWHLDTTAYRAWAEARRRWKADAVGGAESASVTGAMVKADVQAARVALVLAESLEPGKGGPIPPEAIDAAITIVDYVIGCWRALPESQTLALSRRDETLDRAVDQLRAWLEDHGGRATRRDLMRAHVAGCRTAADLDALLERYRATYPNCLATERPAGASRPALVIYSPATRNGR